MSFSPTPHFRIDQPVELLGGRQHAERAGIEHRIEQAPAARKNARQARRRAHDVGEQPQQARICAQQRKELHAGRQLGEEAVEAGEGAIGIGGIGERRHQQRLHLGQALARPRAAHRRVAAMMPAADDGQHLCGPRVAHFLQRRRRCRDRRAAPANTMLTPPERQLRACPRTAPHSAAARVSSRARQLARERRRIRDSRRTARSSRAAPDRRESRASARRPPSAADARCARR